jgi:hypothetical protein
LGWNDFVTPRLEKQKKEIGVTHRTDIVTVSELMDLEEGRRS